jgi:hypothetical protein
VNNVGCGSSVIIDLGQPTQIGTLVFYEAFSPACATAQGGGICLDWVYIDLSASGTGPWINYFNWGDGNTGNNGDVPPSHYLDADGEADNEEIPSSVLNYPPSGIGIAVGTNTYRYIRFSAPPGCGDPAQIDSIDIIP